MRVVGVIRKGWRDRCRLSCRDICEVVGIEITLSGLGSNRVLYD